MIEGDTTDAENSKSRYSMAANKDDLIRKLSDEITVQARQIKMQKGMNAVQEDLIKRLWVVNTAQARRIETQQGMIDWLQAWKAEHERQSTPRAREDALFEKG